MDRPSEYFKLAQALVVLAIGILAIIVMFDSKTRRDHENRLSLVLGVQCAKLNVPSLKKNAKSLANEVKFEAREVAKKVEKQAENYSNYIYQIAPDCDPNIFPDPNMCPKRSYYEGYGITDDTACMDRPPYKRINCNLPSGNNHNYYEGMPDTKYYGFEPEDVGVVYN